MKIKPVDSVPVPGYPDKYAKETRKVLTMARPRRWSGAPLAVGILAATVALGLSGCVEKPPDTTGGAGQSQVPFSTPVVSDGSLGAQSITMGVPMVTPFNTLIPLETPLNSFIPLFEYGEGTGSIGCMSIAAPVFMSEEEAYAILSAVFAEAGLEIDWSSSTLEGATIPVTNLFPMRGSPSVSTTKQGDLNADGLLETLSGLTISLPIEFVSSKDFDAWHKNTGMESSVSSYNILEAAKTLAENNPGLIVFYDPVSSPDFDKLWSFERKDGESDEDYTIRYQTVRDEEAKAANAQSELLLREQANALIEWLRGEGVI